MSKIDKLKKATRKLIGMALALTMILSFFSRFTTTNAYAEEDADSMLANQEYIPGEAIIVTTKESKNSSKKGYSFDIKEESLMTLDSMSGARNRKKVSGVTADEEIKLVRSSSMTTEELIDTLKEHSDVVSVEPNYIYHLASTPDLTGDQYMAVGSKGSVSVPNWNEPSNVNADGIVVALLDSGVDYYHEDLKNVMWSDGEKYPELVALGGGAHGIDCVAGTPDPMDDLDHGTHCAGIIASQWNGKGTSGIANGAKIMAVKAADSNGQLSVSDTIKGFDYIKTAIDCGVPVKVMSNSWGDPYDNYSVTAAVKELQKRDVVVVFASGNESDNADLVPMTTNMMSELSNVVVVNATDKDAKYASFSNYGANTTSVAAPGVDIMSTYPTSMGAADARFSTPLLGSFFDGGDDAIQVESAYKDILEVVSGDGIGYKSNGCLKITPSGEGQTGFSYTGDLSAYQPEFLTLLWKADEGNTGMIGTYIKLINGTDDINMNPLFSFNVGEWNVISVPLPAGTDYENFEMRVGIFLSKEEGGQAEVLVDNLMFTNEAFPYQLSSGTSMAAPVVAGEAAILRKQFPEESAEKIAARIIGSVDRYENQKDKSISGGIVNVTKALNSETAPVLFGAKQENNNNVIIDGYFFGTDKGTVTIDEEPAEVTSWSDTQITVNTPSDFKAGDNLIEVTKTSGDESLRDGHKRFLLGSSTKRFTMLDVPEELTRHSLSSMVSLYGKIYLTMGETGMASIWEYDPKSNAWTLAFSTEENVEINGQMFTYEGRLVLPVTDKRGRTEKYGLLQYEPTLGKSSMLYYTLPTKYVYAPTVVNDRGRMLIIGGYDGESGSSDIYELDMETGEVKLVGELEEEMIEIPYAFNPFQQGDDIFLAYGVVEDKKGTSIQKLERGEDGTYKGRVIKTDALPEYVDTTQQIDPAITSFRDGALMTGVTRLSATGDFITDTYIVIATDDDILFYEVDGLFSMRKISNAVSTVCDGKYYVLANSSEGENGIMFGYLDGYEAIDESSNTKNYTVKFNTNGGSKITSQKVKEGAKAKKPSNPKKAGYTFAGWYSDKALKKAFNFNTSIKKISTIYAKWTKVSVSKPKKLKLTAQSKGCTVSFSKVSGAKGYEIFYSTKKNLSGAKKLTVTTNKKKIANLKKKTKYYVLVRAYKLDSTGKKVYSSKSASKAITTKVK